jgi:hypothetical protein
MKMRRPYYGYHIEHDPNRGVEQDEPTQPAGDGFPARAEQSPSAARAKSSSSRATSGSSRDKGLRRSTPRARYRSAGL